MRNDEYRLVNQILEAVPTGAQLDSVNAPTTVTVLSDSVTQLCGTGRGRAHALKDLEDYILREHGKHIRVNLFQFCGGGIDDFLKVVNDDEVFLTQGTDVLIVLWMGNEAASNKEKENRAAPVHQIRPPAHSLKTEKEPGRSSPPT